MKAKSKPNKKVPVREQTRSKTGGKMGLNGSDKWILRLYVAGETAKSLTAFANLKKICEEFLPNRHSIEVIDLSQRPELAQNDQIIALPTLVRKLPEPIRRVIGDLSNQDRVLVGMDIKSLT